jgi:DNA uptake protein ComE-like DNA-binding protein
MRKRRGIAFVLALLVLVAVALLLTAASQRVSKEINQRANVNEDAKAEMAAVAGVQRALAELTDFNASLLQPQTDTWATLGDHGNSKFLMGKGMSFRMEIVDAGAKVNLNTAPENQLRNLGLTDEQVDSLLDWRETSLQSTRQLGGKDEYYNNLSNPYNTQLGKMNTIGDVLLVKGFTAQGLLDPPTNSTSTPLVTSGGTQPALIQLATVDSQVGNVTAEGGAKTNVNTANQQQLQQAGLSPQLAQAIVQRRQTQGNFTTLGQVFALPGAAASGAQILNQLTATTDQQLYGRINLNTATEPVLRSIPNLPSAAVDTILSNNGGYTSLGDLASVSGVQASDLVNLADTFTVGSQVMVVRVLGTYGSRSIALEVTLDMSATPAKVRRIERIIPNDPIAYWSWSATTNQDVTLLEDTL